MNNIGQITNYSISNFDEVTKSIQQGGSSGRQIDWTYKVIPISYFKKPLFKIGYCCEVLGINFPIFLTIDGEEREFRIGKTGMLEYQPETFIDANDEEAEEKNIKVLTTEVKVPVDIKFTLDYCYSI